MFTSPGIFNQSSLGIRTSSDSDNDSEASSDDESDTWSESYLVNLGNGLQNVYQAELFTDVTVTVGSKTFQCHKCILAALSPFFRTMFTSNMRESIEGKVELKEISSETFSQIIEIIYSGKNLVNSETTAAELISAVTMLQVECLRERCELILMKNLRHDNCLNIWRIGKNLSSPILTEASFHFILQQFESLAQTDTFLELEVSELLTILEDDNVKILEEENVCRSVVKWFQHDDGARRCYGFEVFKCLRLCLVSSEFYHDFIENFEVFQNDTRCTEIMKKILYFHMSPARQQELDLAAAVCRKHFAFCNVAVVLCNIKQTGNISCLAYAFKEEEWFYLANPPNQHLIKQNPIQCATVSENIFLTYSNTLHEFSCYNASWKSKNWAEEICRENRTMVSTGDSVFALAGGMSKIYAYHAKTNKKKQIGELTVCVCRAPAACLGSKIYVFGGSQPNGEDTPIIQCLDTYSSSCTVVGNLPFPVSNSKLLVVDGVIFIFTADGAVIRFNELETETQVVGHIPGITSPCYGVCHFQGTLYVMGDVSASSEQEDCIKIPELCNSVRIVTNGKVKGIYSCVKMMIPQKFLSSELQS